jgi:beta-glucosidase
VQVAYCARIKALSDTQNKQKLRASPKHKGATMKMLLSLLALIRTAAPFETLHPNYFFGARQHEGDLSFRDGAADYEAIKAASAKVPTVATIYLDRPAILTNVKDKVAALLGNFGVSDAALFDALTGKAAPQGRLPFELPSSMDEVKAQSPDAPHDTARPLYRFGFGIYIDTER